MFLIHNVPLTSVNCFICRVDDAPHTTSPICMCIQQVYGQKSQRRGWLRRFHINFSCSQFRGNISDLPISIDQGHLRFFCSYATCHSNGTRAYPKEVSNRCALQRHKEVPAIPPFLPCQRGQLQNPGIVMLYFSKRESLMKDRVREKARRCEEQMAGRRLSVGKTVTLMENTQEMDLRRGNQQSSVQC